MNTTELVVEIRPKKIQAHTHKHYWSYVLIDPIFSLTLSSYWSYILTDLMFLLIVSTLDPILPLILSCQWSYVAIWTYFPLILCSYLSFAVSDSIIPPIRVSLQTESMT